MFVDKNKMLILNFNVMLPKFVFWFGCCCFLNYTTFNIRLVQQIACVKEHYGWFKHCSAFLKLITEAFVNHKYDNCSSQVIVVETKDLFILVKYLICYFMF